MLVTCEQIRRAWEGISHGGGGCFLQEDKEGERGTNRHIARVAHCAYWQPSMIVSLLVNLNLMVSVSMIISKEPANHSCQRKTLKASSVLEEQDTSQSIRVQLLRVRCSAPYRIHVRSHPNVSTWTIAP